MLLFVCFSCLNSLLPLSLFSSGFVSVLMLHNLLERVAVLLYLAVRHLEWLEVQHAEMWKRTFCLLILYSANLLAWTKWERKCYPCTPGSLDVNACFHSKCKHFLSETMEIRRKCNIFKVLKWKKKNRASLVAQWSRICLPMQGTRVRALVQEDPTCRGATKPVRHNYWACALEPTSHNYWSPCA